MAEKDKEDRVNEMGGDISPTGLNPRDMNDEPTSSLAAGASASATRTRDNLGGGHGDGIKGVSHNEMATRSDTSAGARSAIDPDDDDARGNR